jgi:hypothetical protein
VKREDSKGITQLTAENITEVEDLETLEKMLLQVRCSPIISVANWSQHPDQTQWRTNSLKYRTSAMTELYEIVGKYK